MGLDERKFLILQAIIDDYITTAMPVGSRTISRKAGVGFSPATIRNEMSDLERNSLERKALEDPFLKEAMDGFDENPGSFDAFYKKHESKLTTKKKMNMILKVLRILFLEINQIFQNGIYLKIL